MANVAKRCYDIRRPGGVDDIGRRSQNADDDFNKLSHYIGPLGATYSSVNAIVTAMAEVPVLSQISSVRIINAPDAQTVIVDQDT
jgi:hypothetical protein